MKKYLVTVLRLFFGIFLYGVGIVCTINANLGLAPWDVLHEGMTKVLGITMGQAAIGVGFFVVILDWILGEKVGIGTLINMLFVGVFIDILMLNDIIPIFENIAARAIMMIAGLFIIGVATYFYIGEGLGSGPRDGLMVALTKKTNKSVRLVRNSIEAVVLSVGYLLGGTVGIGTLFMVLAGGYIIQFVFKIFKFDVKKVQHKFIDDYIRERRQRAIERKKEESIG